MRSPSGRSPRSSAPVLRRRPAHQPADRMNGAPAVEVVAVSVRLDGHEILRGVDLTVAAGEWVTVIGPNGAGKSTLLRAVGGLVRHTGDRKSTRLNSSH